METSGLSVTIQERMPTEKRLICHTYILNTRHCEKSGYVEGYLLVNDTVEVVKVEHFFIFFTVFVQMVPGG